MLGRLVLIGILAASLPASAKQGLGIHISQPLSIYVSTTAAVSQDPGHRRTLRDALAQALVAHTSAVPVGFTIDASIMRLDVVTLRSGELEVTIEVRASLSDDKGRMRWTSSATTQARGRNRDRGLLHRDAFADASRQLVKQLAARKPD